MPCSPLAAAHPYVGSRRRRSGRKTHNFISLLCVSVVKFACALRANSIRRRHWPASFLWSSPANAGLCCLCIDSRYAAGLHLSPSFRSQRHDRIFWSKNRFFPPLPRIYAECARQAWGKAIFCLTTTSLPSDSRKQRKRLAKRACPEYNKQ